MELRNHAFVTLRQGCSHVGYAGYTRMDFPSFRALQRIKDDSSIENMRPELYDRANYIYKRLIAAGRPEHY